MKSPDASRVSEKSGARAFAVDWHRLRGERDDLPVHLDPQFVAAPLSAMALPSSSQLERSRRGFRGFDLRLEHCEFLGNAFQVIQQARGASRTENA